MTARDRREAHHGEAPLHSTGVVPRVGVTMLGRFEMALDGRVVAPDRWEHRRAAQLVALLALADRHSLHRDQVVDALWPDLDPRAGLSNLHKAAHYARRSLRDHDAVRVRGGRVALFPDAEVTTDAERFERAARVALASSDATECAEVAASYGGELLPEARYEPWAGAPRDRLRAAYVALLRAAGDWQGVAEIDPADEHAHRELMRVQLARGERHAALRTYGRLRATLTRELGLGPDADTEALYEECLAGLQRSEIAELVGREIELIRAQAAVREARRGRVTVLFVRGEAGIGKTTFCRAVGKAAVAEGWTGLRVAAAPDRGHVPYAPIAAAVERLGQQRPGSLGSLSEADRATLTQLGGHGLSEEEGHGAVPRYGVVTAVKRMLATAAKPGGVLVVLDDAHGADAATLDLVGSLARTEHRWPLLLVLPYQPGVAAPLERLRAGLLRRSGAVEVELGR